MKKRKITVVKTSNGAARRRTDMERLTAKNKHGKPIIKDWPNYMEFDIVHRLAAIENILGDEYDLDELKTAMWCKETVGMAFSEDTAPVERLRELWFADKDGRCVVLPCKVEDDVYINILGRTLPFTVISISQMASTPTFKAQHGIRLVYIFKADDVGETVFLTRAEAEEALRREQDG